MNSKTHLRKSRKHDSTSGENVILVMVLLGFMFRQYTPVCAEQPFAGALFLNSVELTVSQ